MDKAWATGCFEAVRKLAICTRLGGRSNPEAERHLVCNCEPKIDVTKSDGAGSLDRRRGGVAGILKAGVAYPALGPIYRGKASYAC
jgi:hypothetical protein